MYERIIVFVIWMLFCVKFYVKQMYSIMNFFFIVGVEVPRIFRIFEFHQVVSEHG